MTPADSRYLRNASFFCSVACGGYAREGSEGQSRRFGANETARNREPEDAARERRRETSGEKPPAKRRVEDMARSTLRHFPTLTDRRSGLDAGRDARARGHERVSARRVHHEWHTRGVGPENTHESSAPARARGAVHFQKLHREASSGFARTREAPWTPLRVQTRPRETGREFRTISTEVRPVCAVGACVVRARVSVFRSGRRGKKTLVREA